ncbi:MAG: beta-lactamase family protein [Verrucomicrobia bacterium]|nr:beta-lactamase family protein [Verrucomicrobiota bacterium]
MFTSNLANKLTSVFQKTLEEEPLGGASLALYHRGEKIFSAYGGWKDAAATQPWEADTITLIWSAGKGVGAACLLHALQENKISLEERVSKFWPEFAQAGKENITIAQLLSHRAGLAVLNQKGFSLTDHELIVKALAAQAPNWTLDGGHGYGARTFGYLIDELLRRITGTPSLAQYWRTQFADPLQLDLWFGIPEDLISKTADVIPAKTAPPSSEFGAAYTDHASLTRRAFMEPGGNFSTLAMNQPALRQASIISSGAISSADALAKFYSILATQDDTRFFSKTTRHSMETPLTFGRDRVLMAETFFSAGFMMSGNLNIFPTPRSFGHPGAGGAVGFAIPEHELGFAFLPNAMHHGVFSSPRTQRLVEVLMNGSKS